MVFLFATLWEDDDKMDLIISALVEAGYFRARISTLSDFDKVIGGMAWAMQVFSQDIDINIFYRDTLDLGQKIALTERLVMVLLVMNCPHKIEPHQIVGLDHGNLLPVIKWLIKRSLEIRREHEAFNRLLALRHYHRVTNTLADRDQWCHVLKKEQLLKNLAVQRTKFDQEGMDESDLDFIERLRKDFKDNQLISFVDTLPAFATSTIDDNHRVSQQTVDGYESDSDEDELGLQSENGQAKVYVANNFDECRQTEDREIEDEDEDENKKASESDKGMAGADHQKEEEEGEEDSPEIVALHRELDTELLATNQKILTQLKKLDSMPSDLEIIQYQRRYIELHQELISKNKDLKKIYALFNSLDSVKHYLGKELNLLDSIMTNLELTNNNPGNRFEFLKQFQEIITKIQAVRGEVNARLALMQKRCDSLNDEYASLRLQYEADEGGS